MSAATVKVYVVDDDVSVLGQFVALLQRSGYVARGFNDPRDLLSERMDPSSLSVIVSDMRMPILSGLDLMHELRSRGNRFPIVFVSGESTHEEIVTAHEDPAVSYVLKPVLPGKLLAAIEAAIARDAERRKADNRAGRIKRMSAELTPTQRAVFACLVKSMSNSEIAVALGTSAESVKKHRQAIFGRFGCESIHQLLTLTEAD